MTDISFYDGAANRPRRGVPDGQRPEIDNSRRERLRRALRERRARQLGCDQDAAGDHQNRAHSKSLDRRIEAIVVASYRSPDSVGKHLCVRSRTRLRTANVCSSPDYSLEWAFRVGGRILTY